MIQLRNTIKSNFQTGDYPTQQQFWDWIDSFIHITEDTIEIANVRNLINELNNKADQQAFQQLWDLFQQLPNTYAAKEHTHSFASLTDKPNTIAGYGITDAYTKIESSATFALLRHDHITEEITDFNTAVEDIINPLKNAINGLAALDADGKLSNEVLPTLSTTEVYTAGSQAVMLALVAQRGDFAIRTDTNPATVYILAGNDATILSNWTMVSTAGGVLTVNGKSGPSVQLTTTDIEEGTRKYFTDALARSALTAGGMVVYNQTTGVISHAPTLGYSLVWDATGTNKVIGKLDFNGTGHITNWGERSLTPGDINAAPSAGSSQYVQITPSQVQQGGFWLTGAGSLGGGINAAGNSSIGGDLLIGGTLSGIGPARAHKLNLYVGIPATTGAIAWTDEQGIQAAAITMADDGTINFIGTKLLANLQLQISGGLQIRENGITAKMGLATLADGIYTATISTSAVTANSRIFLTVQSGMGNAAGGTSLYPLIANIGNVSPGSSFTIVTNRSATGTGIAKIAWLIVEPF